MKSQEFLSVVLKGLGVYCVIQIIPCLQQIAFWASTEARPDDPTAGAKIPVIISGVALVALYSAVAALLFFRSDAISHKYNFQNAGPAISPTNLQTILISSIGIFLIATNIQSIGTIVLKFLFERECYPDISKYIAKNWRLYTETFINFTVGFSLVFFASNISNLLQTLRNKSNANT